MRNQGWWSDRGFNSDTNDNYIVGSTSLLTHRNFFTFDLAGACRASGVTLRLTRYDQTGPLTYSLFDVATTAPTLNANDRSDATIFADLGTGTTFGSFPVRVGLPDDVLNFPVNRAGVAAFNAARGGFFSIGGSIGSDEQLPSETTVDFIFGKSFGAGTQELAVTCLPDIKDQCKNGGWRNYGDTFKNQGQCVAFVQRGPKP